MSVPSEAINFENSIGNIDIKIRFILQVTKVNFTTLTRC